MASLNKNLNDFASGKIEFTDLTAVVETITADNPPGSSALMTILGDARDTGVLDSEQYEDLIGRVIKADEFAVTGALNIDANNPQTVTFSVGPGAGDVATVGDGSVIKERFELIDVLGKGGMGVVYRAKDRIKAEAKDRNPYVAVKVLNEDFKAHPESFIALQRECSRTQKLAHPNIATVYDFDRTGGMAYLTMELLEGQPLNDYINEHLPDSGFSFDDAWHIINSLGQALSFAHHRNIVHFDFKPANAFMTSDREVKVLDFGIARAFKRAGDDHSTVFDAGKLGALTPQYASSEMMQGDPPDPRDDIYALAVVAHVLLSGKHPFDRRAANVAQALKLTAEPIKSLTKLQNRALKRGLEFDRDARTPTVDDFLKDLQGEFSSEQLLKRQSRLLAIISIGFFVLILCVLFLLRS